MRVVLVVVTVLAWAIVPVSEASYQGAAGGSSTPAAIGAGGRATYDVALTGKAAAVDLVFVLDASGSMVTAFGGSTRWDATTSAVASDLDALAAGGFFDGGGRIGLVMFSDAAATVTPTTDVAALKSAMASRVPNGGSCTGCGVEAATGALTGVPGSSGHRRIAYLVTDGPPSAGSSPSVASAATASDAAHVTRRVIGVGVDPADQATVATADSDGTVSYPTTPAQLSSALSAEPTTFPGATNITWSFTTVDGLAPSAPSASTGTATVQGSTVTWSIPALGPQTATLSFGATHAASSGCAQTALLAATAFTDAEGDAPPAIALGPVSISGCPAAPTAPSTPAATGPGPVPAVASPTIALSGVKFAQKRFAGTTKLRLTVSAPARVVVRFEHAVRGRRSGGRCLTGANGAPCLRYHPAGAIAVKSPAGAATVKIGRRLDGGRRLTPGDYRVTITATPVGGGTPVSKTLRCTVLSR
jgi:hypothetical protein